MNSSKTSGINPGTREQIFVENQEESYLKKRTDSLVRFIKRVAAICGKRARWMRARLAQLDTIRLLVLGYLSYVAIGWGVLCLPISHQVGGLHWLDHLFISASAVSTTGLTTNSTSDSYFWFGEFVVLMLIQSGGLGYMTINSFTVLAVAGELSPLRNRVSQASLTLPHGFEVRRFLRVIFWFTLTIEARPHFIRRSRLTGQHNPFGKLSFTA